jgi:arylsulfatase
MRWPGVIQPGRVINDICSLQDFIPTFAAANGETDLVEKVKAGYAAAGKNFKVHLDGENLLPFLKGEAECPRKGFMYWSDDGDLMALRVERFKVVFAEQRNTGLAVWREPLSAMRIPKFFDLRADPFERGAESFYYDSWFLQQNFLLYWVQPMVAKWLESFKAFPPRAKAASFTIDQIVEALMPKS